MPTVQYITTRHQSAYVAKREATKCHRVHYIAAMAFIEAHDKFAAITKDGLLAINGHDNINALDDSYFEAPTLFPVDDDGCVSSRDVRKWLGY